jgi:GT2 family glycosyltransferase
MLGSPPRDAHPMAGAPTGSEPSRRRPPTVLVVLVVRDAADWLRDCLRALAAQSHRPLAVLAVDNASLDGSRDLLEQALGSQRVLALSEDAGVSGSLRAVLELSASREADYLLVMHDDTALDPDAVAKLVEAATLEGVDRVGIVGPKIVDWDNQRILREVGRSTDRFGHPYTPLQDGELDQGQFDRVLEVLFVSSAAMLVSRECLERVGPPDERFGSHHDDLDLCWRARLAGFRVLMTPLARARHMGAEARGRRPRVEPERSERYYGDRAALASMLKNYRLPSLVLLLPPYAVLGLARLLWLTLTRHFDDVVELLAAWGWNVVHLPGTLRRRFRIQRMRVVPDRSIRRFMESSGLRLPQWFETASRILAEQRALEERDEGAPVRERLRHQGVSLIRAHPVVVATFLGALFSLAAFRGLIAPDSLSGGALPSFPAHPDGFFRELLSGVRATGFGGTAAASPALGMLGGLSTLLFSSGALAQKAILVLGGALGAIFLYRSLARHIGSPFSAVVGASTYAVSATVLWAYSEGRVGLLLVIALLPVLIDRFEASFAEEAPTAPGRFVVAVGLLIAVGISFEPGFAVAVALLLGVQLVAGDRRARGLGLILAGSAVAAALVFPIVPGLVQSGGRALSSRIGIPDMGRLARFVLAPAHGSDLLPSSPGNGVIAWFLPVAAVLGLALARPELRARANRAALVGVAAVFLSWASAAGWLPVALSNAPVYTVLAACSAASLVGLGIASILGVRSEAFGFRQLCAGALTFVVVVGVVLQATEAMIGGWAIGGPEKIPPSWAVVRSDAEGNYRVLWIGRDVGTRFPSPGGDPQGVLADAGSSLRYAVTGPDGVTSLDLGRGPAGPGDADLRAVIADVASGATVHAGALLAPLAVRFVVVADGDLPASMRSRLGNQVDLDVQQASGLTIYRNARALPVAGALPSDAGVERALGTPSLIARIQLPSLRESPFTRVTGGWDGIGAGGTAFLSSEFAPGWRLEGPGATTRPERAFGWATAFSAPPGPIHVRYVDQWIRTVEMAALALLWAAALWITRKPSTR